MTAEEILATAADLLETRGWCQHVLREQDGRMCLLGALGQAAFLESESYLAAGHAIVQELGPGTSPSAWNDAPGRMADEVITMIRNSKRWL